MSRSTPEPEALLGHVDFLRRLAFGLLRDAHEAEDVAQETIVRAIERPPGDHPNLKAWLGRVARNLSLDRLRRRRRRLPRPTQPAGEPTDDVASRLEVERQVIAAVEALEEPYRTTLMRRYFDGLRPKEIARRQDIPVKTVRTRLGRALQLMRARLDRVRPGWALVLLPLLSRRATAAATASPGTAGKAVAATVLLAAAAATFVWSRNGNDGTAARRLVPATHGPVSTEGVGGSSSEDGSKSDATGSPAGTSVRVNHVEPPKERRIVYRAITDDGRPVPGVVVSVRLRVQPPLEDWRQFTTDQEGIAKTGVWGTGTYETVVDDYPPDLIWKRQNLAATLRKDEAKTIRIVFFDAGSVRGRVVTPGGLSTRTAVTLYRRVQGGHIDAVPVMTDQHGGFTLPRLRVGTYDGITWPTGLRQASATFEITKGAETNTVFEVRAGGTTVRGRLVGDIGRRNAVNINRVLAPGDLPAGKGHRPDRNGCFTAKGMDAGAYFLILWDRGLLRRFEVAEGEAEVDLGELVVPSATRGDVLRGTIVDDTGKVPPSAWVCLRGPGSEWIRFATASWGKYSFKHVPSGVYRVWYQPNSRANRYVAELARDVVVAGETVLDLKLTRLE